jgi:hypothetical protein
MGDIVESLAGIAIIAPYLITAVFGAAIVRWSLWPLIKAWSQKK